MAFPSISAVTAGYRVYADVDALGNWSKMANDLTVARIVQAGVIRSTRLRLFQNCRKPGSDRKRWISPIFMLIIR